MYFCTSQHSYPVPLKLEIPEYPTNRLILYSLLSSLCIVYNIYMYLPSIFHSVQINFKKRIALTLIESDIDDLITAFLMGASLLGDDITVYINHNPNASIKGIVQ